MTTSIIKSVETQPVGFAPILQCYFERCGIAKIIDDETDLSFWQVFLLWKMLYCPIKYQSGNKSQWEKEISCKREISFKHCQPVPDI